MVGSLRKHYKKEGMLRPYQTKATNNIDVGLAAGINRQLLVMATGTGKTEVFAHLPETFKHRLPGQMMVLLHRDELAQQALNKLRLRNPSLNIQQEAGKVTCDPTLSDVIVTSVQTLGRKNTERVKKFNWGRIDKHVTDEAHRSIAESYMNVYNAGGYLHPDSKRLLLGVTATPQRGDGQGLGSLYQKIVFTYTLREAIEDGYLVDVRGIRVNTEVSLDKIKTTNGDFNENDLAKEVDNHLRNNLVASAYIQNCKGRQAIGFGVNIAHSCHLADAFQRRGINAEAVWGDDKDRADKINRFRDGKIDVLFNAQLLVEGFDLATIECVILTAPTKSGVVFSQRVGRGTRLNPPLKKDCIVLDVVDSTTRHNLITLPTLLGLPKGLDMRGRSLLGTAKAIEEILEKYPHLDFTTLEYADKIEAFVQDVNLFEVKYPKEVEANSQLTWHPSYEGGYVLLLPEKDEIRIEQDLLDKWQIRGKIKGKTYKGERDSMSDAFSAADDLVRKTSPEVLKLVNREAHWHGDPPTEGQLKALRYYYKGKQIPDNLTKGEASSLIGAAKAGRS